LKKSTPPPIDLKEIFRVFYIGGLSAAHQGETPQPLLDVGDRRMRHARMGKPGRRKGGLSLYELALRSD